MWNFRNVTTATILCASIILSLSEKVNENGPALFERAPALDWAAKRRGSVRSARLPENTARSVRRLVPAEQVVDGDRDLPRAAYFLSLLAVSQQTIAIEARKVSIPCPPWELSRRDSSDPCWGKRRSDTSKRRPAVTYGPPRAGHRLEAAL